MKVAIDSRYAEEKLTGIGQYIKKIALALDSKGYEVFLCYSKEPQSEIKGKNIHKIILKSKNRYFFEQILLPIFLISKKIDIYHAAGNIGIPLFCPTPSILTVHDVIPLVYENYFCFSKFPLFSKISYYLRTLISVYKAKKILTDSQFTKNNLKEKFGLNFDKILVVPLGVDTIKKKTKRIIKGKYIINNGGIDIRKNLFRLIEAFSKIFQAHHNIRLVITGENPNLTPKLKEYAKSLKISDLVLFTGYVSENSLWSLIKNAECLCLPTEIEGFGLPVLLSMAAGTPVITSNCSSIPEISGDAAILINPLDVNDIVKGVERVLSNNKLRETLIKKGLLRARKFPWKNTISKTMKAYEEVIR